MARRLVLLRGAALLAASCGAAGASAQSSSAQSSSAQSSNPDDAYLPPAVPKGAAPAAPRTTRATTRTVLRATRIGSLPQALSKSAAVALPGGKLMALGGYTGSTSVDTILLGTPAHLRRVGRLSVPGHDAAAVLHPTATTVGKRIVVTGGGTNAVYAPTPAR